LVENNKLKIWFVGDVQGEERDIIYYSFVQDKKLNNADLRTIYPVVGGTADNIRKLKKQRLNVGFSRAKDKMVFVHSMLIAEYSDTVLGEALKFYEQTLQTSVDNYIEDESIFGSPAEKNLYILIQNTEFYKQNKNKLKIIAQFPIGKYIAEEYQRYLPNYRVDFLLSLSYEGKDKTLILEYDGLEYHFKDTDNITRSNFSSQYIEYDIKRQIELESYGYKFLRINKFNLLPINKGETKVEVLNRLLTKSLS
jgi:very-short-patch-repair endonuclease